MYFSNPGFCPLMVEVFRQKRKFDAATGADSARHGKMLAAVMDLIKFLRDSIIEFKSQKLKRISEKRPLLDFLTFEF